MNRNRAPWTPPTLIVSGPCTLVSSTRPLLRSLAAAGKLRLAAILLAPATAGLRTATASSPMAAIPQAARLLGKPQVQSELYALLSY